MAHDESTAAAAPYDRLVSATDARTTWLGGISETTLWRWEREFADFPKPVLINRRKFYHAAGLRRFIAARAAAAPTEAA